MPNQPEETANMRLSDYDQRELDARPVANTPRRLEFLCHCGQVVGWPDCVNHDCDWTAHDPDERPCEECERFRNCTCTRVSCPECRYVLDVDEQEHFYAANLMVCPQCASRDLREVSGS